MELFAEPRKKIYIPEALFNRKNADSAVYCSPGNYLLKIMSFYLGRGPFIMDKGIFIKGN